MASKDYYEILGVSRDADEREIKRAFLKLARKLHPDVSDDPASEEKFKEVNEAYSVLSDQTKRSNYDRYGNPDGPMGAGFGGDGFVDLSDVFSSIFGGMGGSQRAQVRTRGRDMGMRMSISLAEAAKGVKRTISYERQGVCEVCSGTGSKSSAQPTSCPDCHGTGQVVYTQQSMFGTMQTSETCSRCGGTGQIVSDPCDHCHGSGQARVKETIEVSVPAGVMSGQSIVFRGKGEAGLRGKPAGDLQITIEVAPHPVFERHGDDLYRELVVDALAATVGTTIAIDGILEGERIEVAIPAGTQHGADLRIPNKGMPRYNRALRGTLHCVIALEVPSELPAYVREALERYAKGEVQDEASHNTQVEDKVSHNTQAQAEVEDTPVENRAARRRRARRAKRGEKGRATAQENFSQTSWDAPANPFE